MCGLTGILNMAPLHEEATRGRLQTMNDQIIHRGPDAEGLWLDGPVALGHRRLSILDLSPAGAQPMVSRSERYVVAYNGEIYNHLEMRADLEARGGAAEWQGHSDTETLLAAIEHYGLDDALRRAAGMFALALWDRHEKRLFLARDRMGEKPLYWGWAGRALVFASELKPLRAHPDFDPAVDQDAVAQYLRFNYIPAPRSIYRDACKLEPGCILEIDTSLPLERTSALMRPGDATGGLSIRRYWALHDAAQAGANDPIETSEQAVDALEDALGRAVQQQMISDVPLGAFLSGGVDSSAIVALMQQASARPVNTFTIGFDREEFDESPHAARVAAHLGTDHHVLNVTDQDARNVIPDLPGLYDEPFADPSQLPTHLVCRAAREHVTVALSGDAGDELFGGYNRYLWGPRIWNRAGRIPAPLRRVMGHAITTIPISAWDRLGQLYSKRGNSAGGIARAGIKAHRVGDVMLNAADEDAFFKYLVSNWTDPARLVPGVSGEADSALEDPMPRASLPHLADRMAYQDMRSYLPDDILCKVDRAAMGISLETRAPFLHPEVIALSMRMPNALKIKGQVGKWPLREMLYRHVPRDIIERPKAGFAMPVAEWLRGPLRDWAEGLLSEEALSQGGLLDPVPIRRAWAEHLNGRRDWHTRLWTVLMLQAWLEH